ncbi:hypothetical protein [Devosia riboflavina]
MIEIGELLNQIETYCVDCGIEETTFGLRAVNDGKFVSRLRNGKTIHLKTLTKVLTFLAAKPAREAA